MSFCASVLPDAKPLMLTEDGSRSAARTGGLESMSRSDRLVRLMQALRMLPAPVTAARLAEETGVSRRTLYRDIDTLRTSGAIIDGAAGAGYVMIEDGAMPPQALNRLELEAALLGLAAAQGFGDASLAEAARGAAAKLTASLSERRQREAMHSVSMIHSMIDRAPPAVSLDALRTACWDERAVEIVYVDSEGVRTERTIEPLALVYLDRTLGLLAHCLLRQDYRTFIVARIERLAPTTRSFRPRRVPMLREHLARLRGEGA